MKMDFEIYSGVAVINGRIYYSSDRVRITGGTVRNFLTGRKLTGRRVPHPERGSEVHHHNNGDVSVNGVRFTREELDE